MLNFATAELASGLYKWNLALRLGVQSNVPEQAKRLPSSIHSILAEYQLTERVYNQVEIITFEATSGHIVVVSTSGHIVVVSTSGHIVVVSGKAKLCRVYIF